MVARPVWMVVFGIEGSGIALGVGWLVCSAASDDVSMCVRMALPTVGKLPEIIPRASQVSRLKNSLSESVVT